MCSGLLVIAVDLRVALVTQLDTVARVAGVFAREASRQGQFCNFAFHLPTESQIGIKGP